LAFVIALVEVVIPVAGSETLVVFMADVTSGTVASENLIVNTTTHGFS
jgi:hypothetical protein